MHVLASDEFEGRETGMEGQKKAARYIAQQFNRIGIPPYKDSTYFQSFPLLLQKPSGSTVTVGGKTFEFLKDFYYFPGVEDQQWTVQDVLFLGYGIAEEDGYNDYKGHDVAGKVLMVINGEPLDKDSNSVVTGSPKKSIWTTNYRTKGRTALEKEAKAQFVVMEDVQKNIARFRHYIEQPSMKLDVVSEDEDPNRKRVPQIYISWDLANAILKQGGSKKDIQGYISEISKKKKPVSFDARVGVGLDVKKVSEKLMSENVLGYIEGSDKKDELVIVTAHYDHIGKDGDEIFNGADDDASGTTALLEIAEAFERAKKEGHGPRRSILVMTVAGEEKGLLGSQWYSENPVYPLNQTVADLNIDMIGRQDEKYKDNPDYIYLIGSDKLSSELKKINEENNQKYTQLELDYTYDDPNDPNRYYYRSDHYNFAKNNIPIIFYFNGTHADYHKSTDTVEKINFNKMEKITRLVFHTCWELANRNERIKLDPKKDSE
ncbi:MAG: M28 family peptidase [Flavobacteriales bacterium]|nr:M28 family peptidase [Flavobacteriales bacterium]